MHRADVMTAELPSDVDVVFLYLSNEALATLAPRLACAYGRRAVKVLSRDFELPGWRAAGTRYEARGRTRLLVYDTTRLERPPCDADARRTVQYQDP